MFHSVLNKCFYFPNPTEKLHWQRSTLETRQAGRAVSMFEWLAPPMWEVVPKGDVELLGLWKTIKRL
jgi:hypothetical protein